MTAPLTNTRRHTFDNCLNHSCVCPSILCSVTNGQCQDPGQTLSLIFYVVIWDAVQAPVESLCYRRGRSAFVEGLFLGSLKFFLGLEPVVKFRAGLIASRDVEFVCPLPDSFFE
jgi:hypothetical protein